MQSFRSREELDEAIYQATFRRDLKAVKELQKVRTRFITGADAKRMDEQAADWDAVNDRYFGDR